MLKLLKYEFRKNRTGLLVMLIIAAVLFLMAPVGRALESEGLLMAPVILLAFYAIAAYIFVLVRGISAYSGELKNRTGYLLLMTPHSPVTILFSKLIFTLFFALVMLAICFAALAGVWTVNTIAMPELDAYASMTDSALRMNGASLKEVLSLGLYGLAELLSAVLSVVGMAYLAVTLSATWLYGKRGRGFVAFLIFLGLGAALSFLTDLAAPAEAARYEQYADALMAALPSLLVQLGFAAGCTFLSGVMLKKRVCL